MTTPITIDVSTKLCIPRCVFDWISKMPNGKIHLFISGLNIFTSNLSSTRTSIDVYPNYIQLCMKPSDKELTQDNLCFDGYMNIERIIPALHELNQLYMRDEAMVIKDLEKKISELESQISGHNNTMQKIRDHLKQYRT